MGLRDALEEIWYQRLSRDRRRALTAFYYNTDWKFCAAIVALFACVIAVWFILPR